MSGENYNSVGKDNVSVSPKSYILDKCVITANNGHTVDLKEIVHDIKIHEGLHRPGIIVEIFIMDTTSLINELKISGNEKINIKLNRDEPLLGLQGFELELFIADITKYSEPTPASKSYTFICVSEHMYLNEQRLLNKPFQGTIKALIRKIVRTQLNTEIQTPASSKGIIRGIYPNLSPLDAISWLLRNAFDPVGTHMYFYESAKYGVVLTSYAKILNQDEFEIYNNSPFPSATMENGDAANMFEEERTKITKMSSSLNVSKLKATKKGAFAAVLNTIDISDKRKPRRIGFKYQERKAHKLNDNPPILDEMSIGDYKLTDFKRLKQHWMSYNTKAFDIDSAQGRHNNYHYPTNEQTLMKSRSAFNNLDTNVVDINLPGDFNFAPGTVVGLSILKQADATQELSNLDGATGELFDNYISGKYLVSSVTHHFGKDGYNIKAKIKKDSFLEKQLRQ